MDGLDLKRNKLDQAGFLLLILLSIFICTLLCPFSPIYRYCFQSDESTYHIVSLGLLKGRLPYRDLFDHKGPLTYVIYALGLLLSGEATWGLWVLFTLLNALIFLLLYTNLRLLYPARSSLTGVCALLVFFLLKKSPLYATGSKPDHFVLLLLLAAEYIFLRGIREKKEDGYFSSSDMFLMGLCAGGIFMLKFNSLIYFICFLGAYFIFLLKQKALKDLLSHVLSFLGGTALVSAPFFIFFAARGALSDFIDAYFVFNLKYAETGGFRLFFDRFWFDIGDRLTILLLFVILLSAPLLYMLLQVPKKLTQSVIYFLLGGLVFIFLTLPTVYHYSFTAIIPLYLPAFGYLADQLPQVFKKKAPVLASSVILLLVIFSLTAQIAIDPPIKRKATDLEEKIDAYYALHPDARCLFLTTLSNDLFLGKELPDFQYFYLPRQESDAMYYAQFDYVREGRPDMAVIYRTVDMSDEWLADLSEFFEMNGYSLYYDDIDSSEYLAYVRKE